MPKTRYYFTTRDLFLMAALAALGGVTSTYVNALGDVVQSVVGFAGATQWAAGLHVLWLVLAAGLVRKPGAGTFAGILKGAVELLTGNTHGLLVVLVDIVAGFLVDLGMAPFNYRQKPLPYILAGGLGAASNVFFFQLFASLPADVLAYSAILLLGLVALLSGMLLAGTLGYLLVTALKRAGVVKDQPAPPFNRKVLPLMVLLGLLLVVPLTIYLRGALKGPSDIQVGGAVERPYSFPSEYEGLEQITVQAEFRGVTSAYYGYPLSSVIDWATPQTGAKMVLLQATDGYTFFISMDELQDNHAILLAPQGSDGETTSYNIVGPASSKAWVRGVGELVVVAPELLRIDGFLDNPGSYDPAEWQDQMDSISLTLGEQTLKVQGVPLGSLLEACLPQSGAQLARLLGAQGQITLPLEEVLSDDQVRIFSVFDQDQVSYAAARMNGELILWPVSEIRVE
jgi:energy-coupling factor transport system substrate-specific component